MLHRRGQDWTTIEAMQRRPPIGVANLTCNKKGDPKVAFSSILADEAYSAAGSAAAAASAAAAFSAASCAAFSAARA
jgi:hypothetical protein